MDVHKHKLKALLQETSAKHEHKHSFLMQRDPATHRPDWLLREGATKHAKLMQKMPHEGTALVLCLTSNYASSIWP